MNRVAKGLGAFAALLPLVAVPSAGAATTLAGQPLPDPPAQVVIVDPITGWVQAITGYPTPRPAFLCDQPGNTCTNVDWPFPITWAGVTAFDAAINAASGQKIIVFGYSAGTQVAQQWLTQHLNDPNAPSSQNLTFVLFGNSTRIYGGSLNYFGGLIPGNAWPQSKYQVIDVAREYEYSADQPTNVLSPFYGLAIANALAGGWYYHDYTPVENPIVVNDPANTVWKVGNITYVLIPTENLPLLEPLRQFGLTALADTLNAPLKALIDTAYDRNYPGLISSPQSGQTLTLNAAALPVSGGKVQQGADLGNQAANDVVAGTSTPKGGGALDTSLQKQTVVANPDQGPVTTAVDPTSAVADPVSTTATSANVTSDGNKVEPGQSGPKHRKPGGGLTDALKSVQDTINSSISKITDGFKRGATTKAGDTTAGGEASTGNTTG
jgi:pimeloyl-ACP methyl ester carboxylesterase